MLAEFHAAWNTFGEIIAALPNEVITIVSFFFCCIGIVSVLRSF